MRSCPGPVREQPTRVLGRKDMVTADASAPERAPVRGHPLRFRCFLSFVGRPSGGPCRYDWRPDNRMEIILVRHGRPQPLETTRIRGRELGVWTRQYDAAGIDRTLSPPPDLQARARMCGCVLSSDRLRSVESAAWLASTGSVFVDRELREACLPEAIPIPWRLTATAHVVIGRALWWLNWCRSDETIHASRNRAERAAATLCAMAQNHGTVMLVGHGVLNRLLAARLRALGWRGPRVLPSAYWSAATFIAGRRAAVRQDGAAPITPSPANPPAPRIPNPKSQIPM